MNHIYRIVWSRVRNMFVVACEHASSVVGGSRAARRGGAAPIVQFAFTLSAFGALFYLQAVAASGVEVAGGNTRVFNAPNGVQVVDIATVNAGGVSHNRFLQYNVAPSGQVLNNNSPQTKAGPLQSQLAGQVVANMNLAQEARLILNEVVAPNRSALLGYTEVLGGKADVIVANPYGITCAGCGFINTDRALLTTGVPVFNGSGGVAGFEVRQGDILINGSGLDGRNQNVLDLVARTIRIESQINARNLNLIAGGNDYNYASGSATAVALDDDTPLYAIDSSALGGMYANRIRLIATEQGVGVRMRGEAAATAEDFTLTAAGRIEVASQISAKRDLQLTYNGQQTHADAIDLKASTAELSAGRDLRVLSTTGGLQLAAGKLTADRDIDISVTSLSDTSARITRYAARNARLLTSGAMSIDGAVWGAGNDLDLRASSLSIGAGARLYSGGVSGGSRELRLYTLSGDLTIAEAALQSPGLLKITSAASFSDSAQATFQTQSALTLKAALDVRHAGNMQAAQGLRLDAGRDLLLTQGSVAQSGDAASLTAVRHIEHAGGLQVAAATLLDAGGDLVITDSGTLEAEGAVTLTAAEGIDHAGSVQTGAALALTAGAGIQSHQNSLLEAAATAALQAAGVITHAGVLRAVDRVSLDARGDVSLAQAGVIQATAAVDVLAQGAIHHAGRLESADDVKLEADDDIQITSSGLIKAQGDVDLLAGGDIGHAGSLQAAGDVNLAATGDLSIADSGDVQTESTLQVTASAIDHAGRMQAANAALQARAGFIARNGSALKTLGTLAVDAADAIELAGAIQSAGAIRMAAGGSLSTASSADLQAKGQIELAAGGRLTHVGALRSTDAVMLTAGAALDTTNGSTLHADGTVLLDAVGALTHAGELQTTGTATLKTLAALSTAGTGTLNAGGAVLLDAVGNITHRGAAQSGDALTLLTQAAIVTHTDSSLRAAGVTTVTAGGAFTHSGILVGGGSGTINAGGTFTNQWVVHTAENLTVNAAGITNNQVAGLSSLKTLSLTTTQNGDIDNRGALYAGEAMSLTATGGTIRNRVGGTIDSSGSFNSNSSYFTNNAAVVISGNANIRTTQAFVNETLDSQGNQIRKEWDDSSIEIISQSINKEANEGSFDAGMNAWLHDETITRDERFVGLTPEQVQALTKAQIIVNGAGSTLSINYGGSGLNSGGVISAPVLNIGGSGTFTNQDLTLHRYTLIRRWMRIEDEKSGDDHFTIWYRTDPTREGWDGNIDNDSYNIDNWNPGWGWARGRTILGSSYPSVLTDEARQLSLPGAIMSGAVVIASSGAGIFATNFNFTSGTLKNVGSPWPDDQSKVRQGSAQGGSVRTRDQSLNLAPNANPDLEMDLGMALELGVDVTVNLDLVLGFNLTLPENPNGYFVIAKDPAAKYLVETNPLFGVGSDFVGSDYLAERYGYNPDTVQKRLGDANYEAYLIRQQLIQQTGSNLIKGQQNEAAQMQKLMDNAYAQGQSLGLEFGKPLTATQLAGLTQDIVWMETTMVAGQEVLVPRVYLAASTVAALSSGAVIGGENVNIAGDGLENTGGTIEGSSTLTVNTTGDIRNTSGTLKGGDVSLTSTEGSVINETLAVGAGDDTTYRTAIGKTGGIEATNNLAIDAAKNVEIIGAGVKAGGDASIAAGENIVVDTIVDRSTDTTTTSSSGFLSSSRTRTSTTTETNIGSELDIGGNLGLKSGGDTVIGGSDVKVGGNLDVDTGGDFRVEARQDTETVDIQKTKSGLGVGGGLYGVQKTSIDDFTGTNVGSTLSVGGNASVDSAGKMVIQGSDVNIGGNADIKATEGIAVLDGLDERRTSTTVETTTFLKVDGGSKTNTSASAQDLSAEASASAGASGNFKLAEMSVTNTQSGSNTSVGSNLNVGGNLNLQSDGGVVVQGSNVNAGGDLSVEAKSLDVLTGRNESWNESQTDTASIGIYTDSKAGASANASGGAAQAKAQAGGSFTATAGMRTENEQSSEYSLKNVGSTLTSGGNMDLKVTDTATFQGATVSSGGDMNIEAQDIRNVAAQDIEHRSDSSSRETSGLYVGGEAKASAQLNSGADAGGAGASASAEASAGLRHAREQAEGTSGSVTQVTNTFTSGGDFTRKAQDSIVDQGTQVQAGGDITQSARTIRDEEVHDTTYSSGSSQSHDARIGVAAGASAGASTGGGVDAPSAGVGGKASYDGAWADASESESKAVTSRFQAGGNINSTSQDETVLTGTQFQAGKDINIEAGSLEVRAARDTSSSSSSRQDLSADIKISASDASASAEFGHQTRDADSSTARTGSLDAGGQLNIKVRDNASFEGTQMSGDQGIRIDAGSVDLKSAESTSSSSSTDVSAGFSLSSETKDGKTTESGRGGISGGVSGSSDRSTQDSTLESSGGAVIINQNQRN